MRIMLRKSKYLLKKKALLYFMCSNLMNFYAVKLSQYFLPYDAIIHNLSKLKKLFPVAITNVKSKVNIELLEDL